MHLIDFGKRNTAKGLYLFASTADQGWISTNISKRRVQPDKHHAPIILLPVGKNIKAPHALHDILSNDEANAEKDTHIKRR